jgi:hypothetical protein
MRLPFILLLGVTVISACRGEPSRGGDTDFSALSRADFNRLAPEQALPLFWRDDDDKDGVLDPGELGVFWGLSDASLHDYVTDEGFTPAFRDAYARVRASRTEPAAQGAPEEVARQRALEKELSQSYFILLETDMRGATAEDRAIVTHILRAAELIERIYQKQLGSYGMEAQIPASDTKSRLVFFMNQAPWCSAPTTEADKDCNALASRPEKISGLYPASLQKEKTFCDALQKHPNAKELLTPFTVILEGPEGLRAVPYTEIYKQEMAQIADELTAAAEAITSTGEAAFKTYLTAAAQAFRDNNWFAADEAWAKMTVENSRWYLRIGPDETYYEPCSLKAGFHTSFALINRGSLDWQKRLDPVKDAMEKALAAKAGAPYRARQVSFHLPDFIDIILNAGDSRDARGATIGQSLPNWGPVANEGRGRTVAMTNLYTDADSKRIMRDQVSALFCASAMGYYTDESAPQIMSTVLHEASHNLGPSHEYRVNGKTDDQVFGGPLASMLEELKAQTGALYFTDWLVDQKIISSEVATQAHVRDVTWGFGHISRGLYDAEGKPKPYSMLASIQVGTLTKEGALIWRPDEVAANGKDKGCFAVDPAKFAPAIDKLTGAVFAIKAKGDVAGAAALKQEFADSDGPWKQLVGVITERYLRYPRASFLYAIKQ